jgi:hypothetical protein
MDGQSIPRRVPARYRSGSQFPVAVGLESSQKSPARAHFSQKCPEFGQISRFFADFTAFFASGPLHFTVERF